MPRIGKKVLFENQLFYDETKKRFCYNALCVKCGNECKQSFRAIVIQCPEYRRKK